MKHTWTKFFALGILTAFVMALLLPSGNWAQNKPVKVNINTASVAELQELPRVGESIAQRIVDYRTKNGKFKRVEDLMKVKGIGEKVFLQLKDMITVGEAAF
jgi:comEA protein